MVDLERIDFDSIEDADERSMLRRFVRQRGENSFAIFAGTNRGGRLHTPAAP